jgi:hypothetical protein
MKSREASDKESIQALLDSLNVCHDGWVRRISFLKDRNFYVEGDVYYPSEGAEPGEVIDAAELDIEVELLLNSYIGAMIRQIVILCFERVHSFRFFQERTFDYSEILDVSFRTTTDNEFGFVFRAGTETRPIEVLSFVCREVTCIELDQPRRS